MRLADYDHEAYEASQFTYRPEVDALIEREVMLSTPVQIVAASVSPAR